jgi:hypothetical protein
MGIVFVVKPKYDLKIKINQVSNNKLLEYYSGQRSTLYPIETTVSNFFLSETT